MHSVLVHTLGCKLNQLESEAYSQGAIYKEPPSVIIVNTCTVTSKADQKARRVIRKALRDYPLAAVIVTGCYAQLESEAIKNLSRKDADAKRLLVLKREEVLNYLDNINNKQHSFASFDDKFQFFPERFSKHTRSFLKIQDGCDNKCTYCRIRLARGKSVSLPAEQVLERLKILEQSYAETVLTGVNISQYSSEPLCGNLLSLLEYLLSNTDKIAIRLSSLIPQLITENCSFFTDNRIRPHFHLSIQSASESILKRMGRSYNEETLENAVKLLRRVKDDPFIACDIITGFPGETQEEFEKTYKFCKKIGFSWIHVFPYSARQGTSAWDFSDNIEDKEITKRAKLLSDLASQSRKNYVDRWLGRETGVLVEKTAQGRLCTGVTDNYLKVIIQCDGIEKPPAGTPLRVKLIETANQKYDAIAVPI